MPSIFQDFAVYKPDLMVETISNSPSVYEQLGEKYQGFRDHVLVSAHSFSADWPTWEIHPRGDELVMLITGRAELLLRQADGDRSVILEQPGQFALVPKGPWHTARIAEPTQMLFITPGEGTLNESTPPAS